VPSYCLFVFLFAPPLLSPSLLFVPPFPVFGGGLRSRHRHADILAHPCKCKEKVTHTHTHTQLQQEVSLYLLESCFFSLKKKKKERREDTLTSAFQATCVFPAHIITVLLILPLSAFCVHRRIYSFIRIITVFFIITMHHG
jgi:hypothetical protein